MGDLRRDAWYRQPFLRTFEAHAHGRLLHKLGARPDASSELYPLCCGAFAPEAVYHGRVLSKHPGLCRCVRLSRGVPCAGSGPCMYSKTLYHAGCDHVPSYPLISHPTRRNLSLLRQGNEKASRTPRRRPEARRARLAEIDEAEGRASPAARSQNQKAQRAARITAHHRERSRSLSRARAHGIRGCRRAPWRA